MHTKKRKLIWKAVWLWVALAFFGLEGKAQGITEVTLESISENTYEINSAGDYKITGTSSVESPTSKNIKINVDGTVNITIENVNISTYSSNGAPFDIEKGTVNLTLKGSNSLIATGNYKAGLRVAENTSLTIMKGSNGGSLMAQGSPDRGGGAGIGSNYKEIAGSITIDGGTILAKNGNCAAGIGGGYNGYASSITINGGYVTAITHHALGDPASIGGGGNGNGGTITITGGTVITLFDLGDNKFEKGAIGNGFNASTISVTITGGSIYYNSSIRSITPTDDKQNDLEEKEISSLTPNAKITSLSGADGYNTNDIYADENGKVYLWLPNSSNLQVTGSIKPLTINFTVKKDNSLWTNHDRIFTLKKDDQGDDYTSINNFYYPENGSYTVYANGMKTDQTFSVSDNDPQNITLDFYTVSCYANDGQSGNPVTVVYPKGTTVAVNRIAAPIRNYYTFKGWGNSQTATDKVETITNINAATTLYAIWEANPFTVKTISDQELTYKTEYSYTFEASNISDDITSNAGGIQSIALKDDSKLPAGLTLKDKTISGKPTNVNETGKEVTFIVTAVNGVEKEITITFKVKKAELKVITGNAITKVYDGNNTVTTEEALKLDGVKEGDDISLVAYQLTYDNTNAGTDKTITLPRSFSVEGTATSNYNFTQPSLTLTGEITPKELIVTPASGQSIYQDEVDDYCPAFTFSETVNNETVAFEGRLTWDDNKVFKIVELKLKDNDAFNKDNYELKLSETPVTIEIKEEPASADPIATAGNNDWYISDITLSALTGFKIKADGKIRSNDWVEQLVIDEEGSYEYAYSLKRDDQPYILANKTLSVNLDKTAPSLSVLPNDLEYTLTFSDAGSGIDKVAVDGKDISIASGATTYKGSTTAGKHTATATDKAGNTATVEFELKTDVPPYEPPVPPTPSVYYDVTIPLVEGVTTDPVAGSYPVESYGSFSFILTVGEGYRENSQPVVKANGTVVIPRTSDGKYIVRSVTRDTEITIEGIVRDTPTANAEIDNGLYIRQSPHTLHITTPKAIRIRLIDFAGRIIRDTQLSPGENHLYNIATGSYILQPESGEGIKVRVN